MPINHYLQHQCQINDLYMAFEYINQGRLELTEKLPVSDAAVKYRVQLCF